MNPKPVNPTIEVMQPALFEESPAVAMPRKTRRTTAQAIEEFGGRGIPIFKPRSDNAEIIKRIKAAEKAGAIAVGMDIDAVVFNFISKQST